MTSAKKHLVQVECASQWLTVGDRLQNGKARGMDAVGELLSLVTMLQRAATLAADVAADCRRLERQLRQTTMSAVLCKQLWRELVEQSGLACLTQVTFPTAEDSLSDDARPVADYLQLRQQLHEATADLREASEASAAMIFGLSEPPIASQENPLLPASAVELPPALIGQICRRIEVLEVTTSRNRWLYDRLLDAALQIVQNRLE